MPTTTASATTPADAAGTQPDGPRLRVALGEYDTGWHDPARSLARAATLAEKARHAGADALVLPEMCTTGFTMDAPAFAEPPDGPSMRTLSALAARHGLWIVAGLSMRRDERYVNSALTFAPSGDLAASYDKQRLFGYAGETAVYAGGDAPCVVELGGLSAAIFVCFDLRFPELFRAVGPDVDACVLVANWPAARQQHWETLTRARAIENQCYMIAVNRIGAGGGLDYAGGSRVFDPWGEPCDVPVPGATLRVADLSRRAVDQVRGTFPLAEDRRAAVRATRTR